jgi:hypothetical protein
MAAKLKEEKDIYHHGPKHILIICHLPDPPSFSLHTTFKQKPDNWGGGFKIEVQFICRVVLLQEKHKHVNSLKKFLKFFLHQWRGTVPLSLGKVERVNNLQPGSLAG